jgi:hypothetical protein
MFFHAHPHVKKRLPTYQGVADCENGATRIIEKSWLRVQIVRGQAHALTALTVNGVRNPSACLTSVSVVG